MQNEPWSYFAPPVAAPEAPAAPLPSTPAHPAATAGARHRAGQLAVVLAVVLVMTAVSVVSVTRALRQAAAGSIRAVAGVAENSRGWGPAFLDASNRPARWDPCQPIHVTVGVTYAPPGGVDDVRGALQRLGAASGLEFVEDALTEDLPSAGRPAYDRDRWGERWAPLLVAWVPPAATDIALPPGVEAATISVAVAGPDGASLVTGEVAINAARQLPSGFGYGETQGEVLLHELGHAVGLGHVDDPRQVMYPTTTVGPAEYGAGDRTGLAALGRPAGCHRAPAPHPLDPAPVIPLNQALVSER
ncbi:MAG: matrixin family metalloprotease [Actinomycetota bacterium]|nr:matrixin family metalloprotease [Actinomycetota bacterium]